LNNIGLDVRIGGLVTAVAIDSSWMTVDDGSNRDSGMGSSGVRVVGAIGERQEGDLLRIDGSSSLFQSGVGGLHYPLIRVAEPGDIVPLER